MASEAASSSEPVRAARDRETGWDDSFWLAVVGFADALLRTYYGIAEFTDDPRCVFRIALDLARDPVTLSDGTRIGGGEMVGALHLWNEHLRQYSAGGPDLGWAGEMRQRVLLSLRLLAEYVETEPTWRPVQAFRADAIWSSRLGARQIRRVTGRYGFELIEPEPSTLRRLHEIGASVSTWALTRAFNPSALLRQPFLRTRHELWISRAALLRRYNPPDQFMREPRR